MSVARHGDITSSRRYERLSSRGKATYSRVLDAIDLLVEYPGLSRARAARAAGTTPETIDRYASSAFEQVGRFRRLRPNDRLFRSETMPMLVPPGDPELPEGGVVDVHPTTRRQRSLLGRYWDWTQDAVLGGDMDPSPFEHERIHGHRFELDPERIRARYASGELDIVVEVSPRV
jgi:hypothetical protein